MKIFRSYAVAAAGGSFTLLEGGGKRKKILLMIKWKMMELTTSSPPVTRGYLVGTGGYNEFINVCEDLVVNAYRIVTRNPSVKILLLMFKVI